MSLVSYFPLNGNIIDRINGNIFDNYDKAEFVSNGKFGQSLYNKITESISFEYSKSLASEIFNSSYFSLSFWIYVPSSPATTTISSTNRPIFGNSIEKFILVSQYPSINDLTVTFRESSSTYYFSKTLAGVFPSDSWVHVAITYNGVIPRSYDIAEQAEYYDTGVKIYINDELKCFESKTTSFDITSWDSWESSNMKIYSTGIRYLNEVRVYNHCLSKKEIHEQYLGLILKISANGLLCDSDGYYDDSLYDESGHGGQMDYIGQNGDSIKYQKFCEQNCYGDNQKLYDSKLQNGLGLKIYGSFSALRYTNISLNNFSSSNPMDEFTLYIKILHHVDKHLIITFNALNSEGKTETILLRLYLDYSDNLKIPYSFVTMFLVRHVTTINGNDTTTVNEEIVKSNRVLVEGRCWGTGVRNSLENVGSDISWENIAISYQNSQFKFYYNGNYLGAGDNSYECKLISLSFFPDSNSDTAIYLFNEIRVYNKALSDSDIYNLGHESKAISKSGEIFTRFINESDSKNLSITKSGIQNGKRFSEIVTLEDGSMWLQLMHHDLKGTQNANVRFTSGANVRNSNVYLDENRWSCFPLIKTCDHGTNFELMVVEQEGEESSAFVRHRWIQTVNPYEATYATTTHANITAIENISSSYGGMYPGAENNAWFFNDSVNGDWFGCGLISGGWDNGYVPSYNGSTVKYIQNVYIRVYSANYSERKGGIISAKELKCI